ncbi:MAG TPA: hypothetical protein VNM45_09155 [Bacillus sp. (in: firmicutes)]|nr:hypothetical protein [Bacillus sp. (in: firmicutes)]
MREVKLYTFRFLVKGVEQTTSGKGTNQFEAENNATIKVMRETGAKYDQVKFLDVLDREPTGEWI